MQWIRLFPKLRDVTFAIPNGGTRNIIEARNLKLQGVVPGVPDIFMAIPIRKYAGLFIELKSSGGKLSPPQKKMIPLLLQHGYAVVVCYSLEEAMDAVKTYINGVTDVQQSSTQKINHSACLAGFKPIYA